MCSDSVKQRLYQESNGACIYCGHPLTLNEMQVDHIIPRSKGGRDAFENYVCACNECNQVKKKDAAPEVFFGQMKQSKQTTFKNRLKTMVLSGRMSAQKRQLLLTGASSENASSSPADEVRAGGNSLSLELGQFGGKKLILSLELRLE